MAEAEYELIYHAGIPGRGEFARLLFEATGTPYKDTALTQGQEGIKPYMDGSFKGNDKSPLPFAPPILKHGETVISQTPNILLYLSTHLTSPIDLDSSPSQSSSSSSSSSSSQTRASPLTLSDPLLYQLHSLVLTILDLNNETHDTHHPISVSSYYEDQKEEAIKRAKDFRENRVTKFFDHFEKNLQRNEEGNWLFGERASVADLCLFQVVDGLKFAFPRLMQKLLPRYIKIFALHEQVGNAPRIKSYLESERRQEYSMGVFRYYEELDEPK